ncbi:putative secreted protein with PEP-CTERM sorting signal [Nitrosospira sp. Nsp2]|uniref:HAF repeat-containing PEP-CTERM protein n=1 Tax=Nitrosospira sp. Nsp2 TaxID=136548 RepID=UPI000D2F4EE9|nr:HAF repeat-containing PEP-CTERM protein [Nitrosospira sp. Nsp2]PTR16037.1 putative secreted protein with PEP-CTERM sorting signal [Nitrosospira sp. Nsp2]
MKITRRSRVRRVILASALFGLGFITPAAAQLHPYLIDLNSRTVTELEVADLFLEPARAMNDAGQVAGIFLTPGKDYHALITGPDGVGMRDLGTLGVSYSVAHGINNAGRVVGISTRYAADSSAWEYRGFITGPDGVGMRDVGSLGGTFSEGCDINNSGQVVGVSTIVGETQHAFITGPDGVGMRDLGTLGGVGRIPTHVNDAGQIVGSSPYETGSFITGPDGTGVRDLGTLGGDFTLASGINDAGQVAGLSYTTGGEAHAFITGPDGMGMRDLGALGGANSVGRDINDAGQVVGSFRATEGALSRAFITGPDGNAMVDLNSLVDLPGGVVLGEAVLINNSGQVVAYPQIPEPKIYVMILFGLGLIGLFARRKKAENPWMNMGRL